jgi:hypothetical protein
MRREREEEKRKKKEKRAGASQWAQSMKSWGINGIMGI